MREPFFLLVGNVSGESVTSQLKAAKIRYEIKILQSSVENWKKTVRFLRSDQLIGAIVPLPARVLRQIASDEYEKVGHELFEALEKRPHIAFIHESYYAGQMPSTEDYYQFGYITEEEREKFEAMRAKYDIDLVPYRTNAEMVVTATEFVDTVAKNLLFRMYIPEGRMWSRETSKILDLFRDYLSKVAGIQVRHEQFTTANGVVHELYGDRAISAETLPQKFEGFSEFLDTCVKNPEKAMTLLRLDNFDSRTISEIVDRYSKEGRRLHVDLKQERERKLLGIRHRMEAELTDSDARLNFESIYQLVETVLPRSDGLGSAVLLGGPPVVAPNAAITINVRPQIIEQVNGIVAQEVSGNQNFGPDAAEILSLIQIHAGSKVTDLVSAIHELEDKDSKVQTKLSAVQKLKAFAYAAGGKLTDVGLGLLQAYIEKKAGLA